MKRWVKHEVWKHAIFAFLNSDVGSIPNADALLPRQQQNLKLVPVPFQPGGPGSALPSQVLFGVLRHPDLKLLEPIPVRTERSERGISVIWDEVQEFGFGDTFSDAMTDFADTIAELYLHLDKTEALSDDLTYVRDVLSDYIHVRTQ